VSVPFITLAEIKTFIGKTGTDDDVLIASIASNASAMAERHTGRIFGVQSNTTYRYSTDGQNSITIHDRPYNDATRTVTWNGVTLVENTTYWMLQDRRNPDVSITIQLHNYQRGADWYKADPMWWDKNLDMFWRRYGAIPLDLRIAGYEGHPTWNPDVTEQVTFLSAWFYWRAKSGASGVIQTPTGEEIDLGAEPVSSPVFVHNWRIRTAVAGV